MAKDQVAFRWRTTLACSTISATMELWQRILALPVTGLLSCLHVFVSILPIPVCAWLPGKKVATVHVCHGSVARLNQLTRQMLQQHKKILIPEDDAAGNLSKVTWFRLIHVCHQQIESETRQICPLYSRVRQRCCCECSVLFNFIIAFAGAVYVLICSVFHPVFYSVFTTLVFLVQPSFSLHSLLMMQFRLLFRDMMTAFFLMTFCLFSIVPATSSYIDSQ